eukprot:scaffold38594_cov191-Amphora_coffeaeformis.AAC.1
MVASPTRRRHRQEQQQKLRSVSFAVSPSHTTTTTTTSSSTSSTSKKGHRGAGAFRRALKQLGIKPMILKNNSNDDDDDDAPTTVTTPLLMPMSESTPLMKDHEGTVDRKGEMVWNGGDYHALPDHHHHHHHHHCDADHDNENPRNLERRQRARQAWQHIAAEIKNGDMLLRAAAIDPMGRTLSTDERERARQETQEWIRQGVEFTLTQCLFAVFFYIGIAIGAFSFVFGNWTLVDSVYFAIVTFTTIGYGDLVPDSYLSRIFTCFFALSGVACLGIALGVIGNNVMEAQEMALEQTSRVAQHRVLYLFSSSSSQDKQSTTTTTHRNSIVERGETTNGTAAKNNSSNTAVTTRKENPLRQLLLHFSLVLLLLLIFAVCVVRDPGIDVGKNDIFDAFYYTIITATTVGYGDLAPSTQHGRSVAIIFIPLTVGAMGHFLSSVAAVIMNSRRSSFQKQMDSRELTVQDLEVMDEDGDGQVTRAEYLEFMLLAMGKVDKEFIEEIRTTFRRLDADGTGSLDKRDMIAAARIKLQSPTKKLELARYKQRLLHQAKTAREAALRDMQRRHERNLSFWGRFSQVFALDAIHDDDDNED